SPRSTLFPYTTLFRSLLMSVLSDNSRAALAAGGALGEAIPGFAPRPGQQRLAEAVSAAFESRSHLLAEAGTGTGKTYAYLVPARSEEHTSELQSRENL